MLTLLLGIDWIANRNEILQLIAQKVAEEKTGCILMVPELISHDTERRLCAAAGNTACRFAEVLTFSRLAQRVSESVGHGTQPCLDNGGRLVAMASAARQLHGQLKTYAAVETRPEFLSGLIEAVDEFKRCCITPQDLMQASHKTEGTLAQKLEELSLLLETYDAICQRGKRDPRDQMTWLLEQLEDSDFAQNHSFYIEGFPDFTRQHMAILEHMIRNSPQVYISLNCDAPDTVNPAFEKAASTASELIRFANSAKIPVSIKAITGRNDILLPVRKFLFDGKTDYQPQLADALSVWRTKTVHEECLAAADRILELVRSGERYRDISVVCTDMAAYQNAMDTVFHRCNIPLYRSGTEAVLEKSVIITVLAAIDAAVGGFEQADVVRYMKSVLSPLDISACDKLENYAIMWNIRGKRWQTEWTNHPKGLTERWTDYDKNELERLNRDRKRIVEPLTALQNSFRSAICVKEQVLGLYDFLEQIRFPKRLADLAEIMDNAGDNRSAQITNQLWEILLAALEQLHDVLGETTWDAETFTRLFRLLLSEYSVGTIPPVLDAVTAGPVSAMRCQQAKHLIVLGASEGSLPGYGGSRGVLTDQERTALRNMGVPLTGGAMEGVQAEFAEIYGVFCGAEKTVCVSCSSAQPSSVYRRLLALAGTEKQIDTTLTAAKADIKEASAYLARNNMPSAARTLGISEQYKEIRRRSVHKPGAIEADTVQALYGTKLRLSASQVDKQALCRMAYFLRYGLQAQERKTLQVDPAEFGTYVHAVLEQTARDVMGQGGFHTVSLEMTMEIAEKYSQEYAQKHFGQLDSERLSYLFRRNGQELKFVVREMWQELHDSAFAPVGFEVGFGEGREIGAIPIPAQKLDAQLRGFVDRVDMWNNGHRNYFKVVDYKTGQKDFDYCDIFNGIGLQMLLYLFALEDNGEFLLGENPAAAGVQYFPARAPYILVDGVQDQDAIGELWEKSWKRKGLLLQDEDVLRAMDSGLDSGRLCCTMRKDGSLTGELADTAQFRLLRAYVFALLGRIVDEIASGCVDPNPYTRGSSDNACRFCPYGPVCHPASVEGRRNYKTITAQRFWEDVQKEVDDRG